jgi:DNA-binding transcriptional ArsR family regulator
LPFRILAQRELASLFAVLSHPLRLGIVFALADGERDVTTLVKETGAAQSAVSQSLARLRAARIVKERREARHVYYRLTLAALPGWLDGGYALLSNETAQAAELHDVIERARAVARTPGRRRAAR